MDNFVEKAKKYFILGKIAEELEMLSESASNYFKALSAVNDFMLEKIGLKAKDHSERFSMLKQNYPNLYEITDKLFFVYRKTYTKDIIKEELKLLRKNIEKAFENAKIQIPTDTEIKEKIERIYKK